MPRRWLPGMPAAAKRRKRGRILLATGATLAAVAALVLGAGGAFGGPSPSAFQLDGNAAVDAGTPGDDWSQVWDKFHSGTTTGHFFSSAFIPGSIEAPANDTTAWTQSTKVTDPISSWSWQTNANVINDKTNITDAYAAAYKANGSDTDMYFGLDRFDSSGDANVGFWFLQDPNFSLNPDGTFSGAHVEGDVFIKSEFLNGGGIANPVAFYWHNGSLQSLATGALCTSSEQTLCAIDNDGSPRPGAIDVPWPYTGKGGSGQTQVGENGFFEGGIDLTSFFQASDLPCFTHFVAQTATSSGNSETLKDLAVGNVQSCGTIQLEKHWVGAAGSATLNIGKTAGAADVATKAVSGADGSTDETEVHANTYYVSESVANAGSYTSSLACFNDLNHNGTQDQGEPAVGTSDAGNGSSSVAVGIGDHVVCTYTNTRNPQLTLKKTVVNDNGGTATASQWTLSASANGDANSFSGAGPTQQHDVTAGVAYTLAESGGPSGYTGGSWSCDGGTQNGSSITLAAAQNVTCTIVNNDDAPGLHLRKTVTNDNGGTASATDWTLTATRSGAGSPALSGSTPVDSDATFQAGTYTLAEGGGPSGYTAGSWQCTGGSQSGDQITVGLGQSATCTIVNDDTPPALHLVKTVTNDDGGKNVPTDWTLTATGTGNAPTNLSGTTPVSSGAGFKADTYTLAESGPSGYTAGPWNCVLTGTQTPVAVTSSSVAVGLGQNVTCTVNNDDNPGTLIVIKHVVNDNGGTATAGDFTMSVTGGSPSPASFAGAESPGTPVTLDAGSYSVGESGPGGYQASYSADCTGTIALGQTKTCTVTNDDKAPALHLRKTVTNDDGGKNVPTDWTLTATGTGNAPTNLSGTTPVSSGAGFKADTYTLAESGPSGYTAGPWNCVLTGTQTPVAVTDAKVDVGLGKDVTCTINNNDNGATLIVIKHVVNDDGGSASSSDFTMNVTGGSVSPASFPGAESPGTSVSLDAGSYSVGESGPSGYQASYSADCSGTIGLGETKTCTVTNDDKPAHLIVIKHVVNDNGGTDSASDFSMKIGGVTAAGGNTFAGAESPGTDKTLSSVGSYDVTESGPGGYQASYSAGCTGTIALGQTKTCTVTNDDKAPGLHLRKQVVNDNGGAAKATDWTLTATGTGNAPTNLSGTTPVDSGAGFKADTYTLAESGPSGYTAGAWQCDGGDLSGNQVTVGLGQDVTCTIVNNDNGPSLHLRKVVVNDDGGTAQATDWTLTATKAGAQSPTLSGSTPVDSGPSFQAGSYALDENGGPANYTAGNWNCVLTGTETAVPVSDGSVSVGLGQNVTCTITNDDDTPTVTIEKRVLPSTDKGTFDFTIDPGEGRLVLDNGTDGYGNGDSTGAVDVKAGDHTITESGNGSTDGSKYSSTWSCSSDRERSASGSGTSISLNDVKLGENVTCTFTNTRLATLIVKKIVDNSNGGGSKGPGDFTLHVTTGGIDVPGSPAAGSSTGTSYDLLPGTYNVSEGSVSGYSLTSIQGCLADGSITLEAGQVATCTLTNTSAAPPPPPPPPPPAPKVDIQITKSATPNPATLGKQVTWTMVVTNNGPNNATGVTVADPVPAGMSFVSVATSQGTCTGGVLVSCQLGNLNVGNSVTITLVTKATTTGTIVNTATTVANEQETNTANNTASANVTVKGAFVPPVHYCTAVAVTPKQLLVGHKNTMRMKVTEHGKAKAGVRIRVKGSTVSVITKRSDAKGIVHQTLKPMKPGIIVFKPVAVSSCQNPRVGVIGVFTPPVTG